MKLLNHLYHNFDDLERFCTLHEMQGEKSVLIQLFGSEQSTETLYRIRDEVSLLLPNASLIATTSAGNIDGGEIIDGHASLSFSIFERTDVSVACYKSQTIETVIDDLAAHHVNDNTKLLIVFANTFRFDSAGFLELLDGRFPQCSVAGGNAGDDFRFERCDVFSTYSEDCDVVVAALSSTSLQVRSEYLLHIQTIGQEMWVTKSSGDEVIEINHQSPLSLYSYYLGEDVANNILTYGIEFPLMFKVGDVDVARAPVAVDKERGTITFAGSIPEGSSVKFGYANIEHIEQYNHLILAQKFTQKMEAVYVYSCAARRQILGQYLKDEIALLEQIVPSTGFITYGEFFHDSKSCRNALLNITTTMVVLSENSLTEPLIISPIRSEKDQKEVTLKALTTLITKTGKELKEYKSALKHDLDTTSKNLEDKLHYTAQYEEAINSTTAIIKTDTDNIITYVNEKFCLLSGFESEELIGRNCEVLRHEKHRQDGICSRMREQLLQKKTVQKIMTNITKNGDEYIINNLFYPVIDIHGNVIEYIQIMHDVTEIVNLNKEIVDTQREIVTTMGMIGETRSQETGLHVKRVAEYSYLLAKLIGLSEEEATLLKEASPMHDIGKVGIPDHILNKPGKFTPEEFEIMKTHAELGYEMLKHSEREILRASAVVAYTHHERWDGNGYPRGVAGDDIPIFGRITAIADVFDALGHDRVYKEAWPLEKILELFREERGKHFDPTMIDLFFDHLDQFLAIRDQMQD